MSRRATGVSFCAIAAFLFASRYIAAAIFSAGTPNGSREVFGAALRSVGPALLIVSGIALVAGLLLIALAEMEQPAGRPDWWR